MKILINDNELDALKDNDVLLTKAVNKMQSLEERNGSFSSEVACGMSMNNRDIFKNAQSSNSVTEMPYTQNTCRISVGSVEVLDGFAELEQTNKEYMLRAYSGVSSIIEAIGESMLNELNLDYANGTAINHIYNWTNVIANRNNLWTKGYIYPNIDYGKWATTTIHAHWDDLYPSIFCKYLFLRIFHSIGYAVTGEFISNDLFGKEILPMVKIPTTPQYFLDSYTANAKNYSTKVYPPNLGGIINMDEITNTKTLQLKNEEVQNLGYYQTVFRPALYGEFSINFVINCSATPASKILRVSTITISKGITQTNDYTLGTGVNNITHKGTKVAADTYLQFGYLPTGTGNFEVYSFTIAITYPSRTLTPGDFFDIRDCLPEVSQKDFLTTIINQYNLMLKVDTTKRTVDFSYFNSVEANKNSALDWSELFDFSKELEIKYKLEEYAQNSLLKYETDENDNLLRLSPTYGQGVLFCNNVNLENTKEVFMSKFAPIVRRICLKSPHTSEQAYIQLWITEENTLRTQNVKPRIAYVRYDETLTLHGTAGEIGGGTGAKDSTPSAGVYFQQLEFSRLIPLYYKIVSNMLLNTYTLKANFNLKLKDFEEVDFTKPIYLELNLLGYGAICGYFYCDSINEFSLTNKTTTEVELIRI
jgi:hypothetical protein